MEDRWGGVRASEQKLVGSRREGGGKERGKKVGSRRERGGEEEGEEEDE